MIVRCLDLLKSMCSFIRHSVILTGRTDIFFTEDVLIVNSTPVDLRFVVASSGRMCIRFPLPFKEPSSTNRISLGAAIQNRHHYTGSNLLPSDLVVSVLSGRLLTFHVPKINVFAV